MKVFIIYRDKKEVDRESVTDCASVDAYANRKFGSHDYKASGIEIKMVDPVPPKKAEEPKPAAAPAKAAEPKPAEAPKK